ncbi:MAG TPA: enoyl-CoA hydratase-related protein [Planctomycetota bacterium]|nr:enoyl-CoA hydratase-related protein [Planctomycetota bacterium]
MNLQHVLYAVADRIATVTVNRPDKLNALNDAVMADIDRAVAAAGADPAVGVVVLTGAGEKAFVAGADIGELAKQTVVGGKEKSLRGQAILARIEGLGKPVIAAVNGYAFGGGLELALACHLRYFAATAKVGLPECGLGIIPGYGGTQRLPRIVGRGRALELILLGNPIDAATAERWGLANGVFEAAELTAKVRGIAAHLLTRGTKAVAMAMESVLRGTSTSQEEGMRIECDLFGIVSSTTDMREGLNAFLEKRKPAYRGE